MRQFYLEYSADEILQPLVGEISWAKHLLIMGKCKDPQERVKKAHEKPSIDIIICRSKQRTVVEFALRDVNKTIGVATYALTDTLPAELRPFFPSNEELVRRLDAVTAALQGPVNL